MDIYLMFLYGFFKSQKYSALDEYYNMEYRRIKKVSEFDNLYKYLR